MWLVQNGFEDQEIFKCKNNGGSTGRYMRI